MSVSTHLPALVALGVPLEGCLEVDDLLDLGPLADLLTDDGVTEILVNGPRSVHVEIDGRLQPLDVCFRDEHHLRAVIERLLAGSDRRLDESVPTVDAMLADGSRLNAVLPPVAVGGPLLTIRRPRARQLHLAELVRRGALPPQLAAFLHAAVMGRLNILVSGGAGAGKTTLLAALCSLVPADQRIVTIEDVAELRIEHPHVAAQQCRPAHTDGITSVDVRGLVRNTLRMRPDRIVVGEVRGAEAADMVAAMNTGHPGSMSTVHANSAEDALSRLETMISLAWQGGSPLTVRSCLFSAVDLVVHCERDAAGVRRVTDVAVLDATDIVTVYDGAAQRWTTLPARCLARMAQHGVHFSADVLARPCVA